MLDTVLPNLIIKRYIMEDVLNADIYVLSNPFDKDFTFKWAGKHYIIAGKGRKLLPKPIAEHGAYKIAEQIIHRKHGFDGMLRKPLVASEIAKICHLYQLSETDNQERILDAKIEQMNEKEISQTPELEPGEEPLTPEEEAEFSALEEEVEDTGSDEEDRKEALKESDPRAYRAEELNEMTKSDLTVMAEELEIEVPKSARKDDIIELIVAAEFARQ